MIINDNGGGGDDDDDDNNDFGGKDEGVDDDNVSNFVITKLNTINVLECTAKYSLHTNKFVRAQTDIHWFIYA